MLTCHCLFPCNRVVYLSVGSCLFKQLNLAEKALVLNFVPDPRVRVEGVHRSRNIFSLGTHQNFSLRLCLDSTGKCTSEIGLHILFLPIVNSTM